ncbi:MAG: UPF0147 family protein [Candidatus Micrarchaeia archaeon]
MQKKSAAENEKKILQVTQFIDGLMGDSSIPKNVKKALSDAKAKLTTPGDPVFRASSAIYMLESVSEDINLPMHARTQIWNIVSTLETIKGS